MKKSDKKMDSKGVFMLQHSNPKVVLAAMVPTSQYKDPEIIQAMEDELEKWRMFGAYDVVPDEDKEAIDG